MEIYPRIRLSVQRLASGTVPRAKKPLLVARGPYQQRRLLPFAGMFLVVSLISRYHLFYQYRAPIA